VIDYFYANIFKTYEVEFCHFTRLQQSVILHWENPRGYNHHQHGYVNICIPFISPFQWHAISVYPHASEPNCSSINVAKAGDWSNKLHEDTLWKTTRPVWIQGPFLTPYAASVEYDNAICVSSGSGISASLAALQSLKKHRRVSVIWLSRDASMVEFYLSTYEFDNDAYTLIYYTGKQKLAVPKKLPPNVLVFQTRPDLRSVICMIITTIESHNCLPENIIREAEDHEGGMCMYAEELNNIENLTDPYKILQRLLGRSLRNYTYDEIVKMLEGEDDILDMDEMEMLLMKITPEAFYAQENLEVFATEWAGEEEGMVSRAKLVKHVKDALNFYFEKPKKAEKPKEAKSEKPAANGTTNGAIHREESALHHKTTKAEAREMMLKGGGSADLKRMLAEMSDSKADAKLGKWAVMYCGGSLPVSSALIQVCSDFDIKYEQEKFEW